jgi:hypothetical protein
MDSAGAYLPDWVLGTIATRALCVAIVPASERLRYLSRLSRRHIASCLCQQGWAAIGRRSRSETRVGVNARSSSASWISGAK